MLHLRKMKVSDLVFCKGDLVHVPQAAVMYGISRTSGVSIYVNQKPSLAIFMNYKDDGMSEVVMNGQTWLVKNKEIYLNRSAS